MKAAYRALDAHDRSDKWLFNRAAVLDTNSTNELEQQTESHAPYRRAIASIAPSLRSKLECLLGEMTQKAGRRIVKFDCGYETWTLATVCSIARVLLPRWEIEGLGLDEINEDRCR